MDEAISRKYSEVAKSSLVRAVIDESAPEGVISPELWGRIQEVMMDVFDEVLAESPGSPPACEELGWLQRRYRIIAFSDQRSLDLYALALTKLATALPTAKLKLVDKDGLPNRPRGRVRLPLKPDEPERILHLLKVGNPSMLAEDWRVLRVGEPEGRNRLVTLLLNEGSVERLKEAKGKVSYGFTSAVIRPYTVRGPSLGNEKEAAGPKDDRPEEVRAEASEGEESLPPELLADFLRMGPGEEEGPLTDEDEAEITVIEQS
jgi:hypothetical protein